MNAWRSTENNKPKVVSMPFKTKKQLKWEQRAKETLKRISTKHKRNYPTWEDVKDA